MNLSLASLSYDGGGMKPAFAFCNEYVAESPATG